MNIIAKTSAVILEISSSFYPEKNGVFSPDQSYILRSQQTWVQFGTATSAICGPSPFINTMNCFSSKFKNYIKSIPIPGDLATTPVFAENTWIIGTTKGFLFRVKTESSKDDAPGVTPDATELWGSYSKQIMEGFVPQTIYKESSQNNIGSAQNKPSKIKNYDWIFPTSSPFSGTPVVHNKIVYGITANQTLQAIGLENGKLLWSTKLASQASLYLANHSIYVTDTKLLVASDKGELLLLNPETGDQINRTMVSTAQDQENRFPNIVAAPLYTNDHHIVVSNALSTTKKLALNSFNVVWKYPEGSVNTPLQLDESKILILTINGNVVSLDNQNGAVNWKTDLQLSSPISAGILTNNKKTILIATQRGELIAVDSYSGKILTQNRAIGSVVGNFFKTLNHSEESCLSFSTGSFRCFKVKR